MPRTVCGWPTKKGRRRGARTQRADPPAHKTVSSAGRAPDPTNGRTRRANAPATNMAAPRNTLPRLFMDSSNRMWLAFRSANPIWWNPIGTVWTEYVMSYDGTSWTAPVYLAQSDNILDNRPALASRRAGELTVVGSSDGRRQFHRIQNNITPTGMDPDVAADPYQNDLFANVIALAAGHGPLPVKPGSAVQVSGLASTEKEIGRASCRERG